MTQIELFDSRKRQSEGYPELLTRVLSPKIDLDVKVLDLFAGCGGLALGFEAAGFQTTGIEMNVDACDTYSKNLLGKCINEELSPNSEFPEATVVIGGPPCQPFSVGGKQLGLRDSRDGFPTFIAAIEQLQPSIWMFENVRGMRYRNSGYLDEVLTRLQTLGYELSVEILNARDYQVPQNRERLVVVGHSGTFQFPFRHSERISAGEALGELATAAPIGSRFLTPSMDKYVAKYEAASKCRNPRDLHLDLPARTLTCRNLAGATGDMQRIRLPDGRRRRLLTNEAARLQSFPDWFNFSGRETAVFNQIGNAVAPMFAYHLALEFRRALLGQPSERMTQ